MTQGTRNCDGCTLCCKVLAVEALEKPPNVLCRHCEEGKGCTIYDGRPQLCRTFLCGYLLEPSLGPEWHPRVSGLILMANGPQMVVTVDPARPDMWRREPCYSAVRQRARAERRADDSRRGRAILSDAAERRACGRICGMPEPDVAPSAGRGTRACRHTGQAVPH
ncbi:MAG TPA: hypothetical protein VMH86_11320 [Rhizomicrobium sp.]|nr:hypothetical protein [Rhizomicrobium sp.]